MCFSLQRRANFPQLNVQKCSDSEVFCAFWLANVLLATAACHFSTSKLPKVSQDRQFFSILTCKCASRQGGVPFFDIWTSKSAQGWTFLSILTWNVLRATAACHFWTSELQKMVRAWGLWYIFTWNVLRATAACNFSCPLWAATSAPAALASLLFDPADAHIIEKTQHFATFLTFRAGGSSFCWLSRNRIFFLLIYFSSLLFIFWLCFSALLFQLSILSEVRLLNFLWLLLLSLSDIVCIYVISFDTKLNDMMRHRCPRNWRF